jgi:hypothetical protein
MNVGGLVLTSTALGGDVNSDVLSARRGQQK